MWAVVRCLSRDARGRGITVVCCLVLTLSGCGTTVGNAPPVADQQTSQGTADGLAAGTVGADNAAGHGTTAGSFNAGGGAAGQAGTVLGASGSTAGYGTGNVSGSAGALTSRGVTASTITVGIPLPSDTTAVANGFGIKGAGSVSEQDMVTAVINDVNRTGGVLGRKLAADIHPYSIASYISNPAQTDGEICADFRDDRKVFSVIFNVVDDYLRQCSAAMGSPLIIADGNQAYLPAADYQANGGNFLFGPTAITAERLAHLFVVSLMTRNFAQPWNILSGGPGSTPARLGLIHVDTPDQDAYYADIAKDLAKYGLKFADTFTYDQNADAAVAGTQSAVLKFKAAGITHVFGASAFFMDDAQSQKYYPRYAYLPGLGQLGAQNVPAAEMNGALTVGWAPVIDVAAAQDPGDTPGAKHCRAVMIAAGLSVSNRSDLEAMYSVCDAVYSFRAALDAGRAATVHGLRIGYETLGASFPTALSFSVDLGPNQHAGIDTVRDMAWDSGCGCLKYTSSANRS